MGLLKTLLWGDEDELAELEHSLSNDDDTNWDEATVELTNDDSSDSLPVQTTYDPEQSIRRTLEREANEVRERDALNVRVGHLALALESVLRLLKDKGVISDLDLRRMAQQVDLEDGHSDDEYHPGETPIPSHCPKCEARIPSGKRLCQLCGHRFPAG